jgi:hypothetical protein
MRFYLVFLKKFNKTHKFSIANKKPLLHSKIKKTELFTEFGFWCTSEEEGFEPPVGCPTSVFKSDPAQ